MRRLRTPSRLSCRGELPTNAAQSSPWPNVRGFGGKLRWLIGLVLLLAGTGLGEDLDVQIPSPPPGRKYLIYELDKPDLTGSDAARIARGAGLMPVKSSAETQTKEGAEGLLFFVDRSHVTRLIFVAATGGLVWLSDLASLSQRAPSAAQSTSRAQAWVKESGLTGKNQPGWEPQGVTTLSKQIYRRGGGSLPAIPAMQSVNFSREIGGLPVEGPDSVMNVNVGAGGVVGVSRIVRPIQPTSTAVEFKSPEDVKREFRQALSQVGSAKTTAKVNSVKLVYYEQGKRYVQPAYRFLVTITAPKGVAIGHRILIAAAKNPPEAILPFANAAVSLLPASNESSSPPRPPVAGKPDPTIEFGFYFDRLDYNQWASDPWQFWGNFTSALALAQVFNFTWPAQPPQGFSANLRHFQFDFPWMWEKGPNYSDFSAQFVDTVHFAMVTGHGLPFSMATLQEYADAISVQQSKGFGAFNGTNNALTDYIVWRGCYVIPSPDPSDKYPNPVAPWFSLFQGLRGTYGYHTEMTIEYQEGPFLGQLLPFGFGGSPILSSWVSSVANATNSMCATKEYNCASAVIVTGNENDTIFDLTPVHSPQSLTIWWQSPGSPSNSSSVPVP